MNGPSGEKQRSGLEFHLKHFNKRNIVGMTLPNSIQTREQIKLFH
jgi:hypothetical protein